MIEKILKSIMREETKTAIRQMGGVICESLYDSKVIRIRFDRHNFILVRTGHGKWIVNLNEQLSMCPEDEIPRAIDFQLKMEYFNENYIAG